MIKNSRGEWGKQGRESFFSRGVFGAGGFLRGGRFSVITPNYGGHLGPTELGKQGKAREAGPTVLSLHLGLAVHFGQVLFKSDCQ